MTAKKCIALLKNNASKERAKINATFFKTEKGEYAENDIFIGLRVPQIRTLCKPFLHMPYNEIETLFTHNVDEIRMAALLILTEKVKNKPVSDEQYEFILQHLEYINNWDFVDLIAPRVIGKYIFDERKTEQLIAFANSENMWIRRIAIVSTYYFIKNNEIRLTLQLSEKLLRDENDLIQKAVGWMLREAWKKDTKTIETFLTKHIMNMSRMTLYYAIEKMDEPKRQYFLQK